MTVQRPGPPGESPLSWTRPSPSRANCRAASSQSGWKLKVCRPALEELAAATRDRFKLRCRFASKGPVAVENSAMATHLYRIAQEAVSNAIKHSGARSDLHPTYWPRQRRLN